MEVFGWGPEGLCAFSPQPTDNAAIVTIALERNPAIRANLSGIYPFQYNCPRVAHLAATSYALLALIKSPAMHRSHKVAQCGSVRHRTRQPEPRNLPTPVAGNVVPLSAARVPIPSIAFMDSFREATIRELNNHGQIGTSVTKPSVGGMPSSCQLTSEARTKDAMRGSNAPSSMAVTANLLLHADISANLDRLRQPFAHVNLRYSRCPPMKQ